MHLLGISLCPGAMVKHFIPIGKDKTWQAKVVMIENASLETP